MAIARRSRRAASRRCDLLSGHHRADSIALPCSPPRAPRPRPNRSRNRAPDGQFWPTLATLPPPAAARAEPPVLAVGFDIFYRQHFLSFHGFQGNITLELTTLICLWAASWAVLLPFCTTWCSEALEEIL